MDKPLREIKGARSGIVALIFWIATSIIVISDGIKSGTVSSVGDALYEIALSYILALVVWLIVHLAHYVWHILFEVRVMSADEYMKFLRRHWH